MHGAVPHVAVDHSDTVEKIQANSGSERGLSSQLIEYRRVTVAYLLLSRMQFLQRYARKILRPFHVSDLRRVVANERLKRLEVLCAGTSRLGLPVGLIDDRGTVA